MTVCPHCEREFSDSLESRYRRDPKFNHLVNSLVQFLSESQVTSVEVRDALILAASMTGEPLRTNNFTYSSPSWRKP